jgi:hypothetical protein
MCLPYRKICGNYCRSRFRVGDASGTAFSGRSRNCPDDQHRIRGADLLRITALGRARDLGTKKSACRSRDGPRLVWGRSRLTIKLSKAKWCRTAAGWQVEALDQGEKRRASSDGKTSPRRVAHSACVGDVSPQKNLELPPLLWINVAPFFDLRRRSMSGPDCRSHRRVGKPAQVTLR